MFLRNLMHRPIDNASALDLRWLGFSYIAFRLIHVLRDKQLRRLPELSLPEFATYVVFFPTLAAGPIDRAERFAKDLQKEFALTQDETLLAGQRIVIGLFKKFVIADTLALLALNDTLATQVHTTGWMWIILYAYAFQIYFDFSGYTDIAIGIAQLVGIKLPENFLSPYTKPNLTQFWNSWHITLTQWIRSYFFNPFNRWIRGYKSIPTWMMILLGQLSTMLLIGLWHGITSTSFFGAPGMDLDSSSKTVGAISQKLVLQYTKSSFADGIADWRYITHFPLRCLGMGVLRFERTLPFVARIMKLFDL